MPDSMVAKPEISLREYCEVRFNLIDSQTVLAKNSMEFRLDNLMADIATLKQYIDLRIVNIENATSLATNSMDKRLESMNEFRGQLNDQTRTFINREEFGTLTSKIDADVRALRDTRGQFIGREEYAANLNKLESDVQLLQLSKASLEGKASATSVYIAWGFSFVGIMIAIVSLLIKFIPIQ